MIFIIFLGLFCDIALQSENYVVQHKKYMLKTI